MQVVEIRFAEPTDIEFLTYNDSHISKEVIIKKVNDKEIITIRVNDELIGWLRYNYFWDNVPFMNMLYINDKYRGGGLGSKAVEYWENAMKVKGYKMVMTSSQSDEQAQLFYRKIGYKDAGCLLLDNQTLEVIFIKCLY